MGNEIGISSKLDWPRIRHLFRLGLFASALTLIGDMILGWGAEDETLTGLLRMFSAYTGTSDSGIFVSAILGLFGITIEGLCYFGIYRLMENSAPKTAHIYRAGILGYVIFGGCGFHVPVCAIVFLLKHGIASELVMKYAFCFVLPAFVLFWLFFIILEVAQIKAFIKGFTPYPKWCAVFSLPVGMTLAMLMNIFGNQPWVNAISCAWISVGNLWMFAGLLLFSEKTDKGPNQ